MKRLHFPKASTGTKELDIFFLGCDQDLRFILQLLGAYAFVDIVLLFLVHTAALHRCSMKSLLLIFLQVSKAIGSNTNDC